MNGIMEDYGKELLAADPSDCRKLIDILTEATAKEGRLNSLSWIAGMIQESLFVFGIMKADPFTDEPKRGDYGRMVLNMKTKKAPDGKKLYILTGRDSKGEIATFSNLFEASIVARYLSGGSMDKGDMAKALTAIADYDKGAE